MVTIKADYESIFTICQLLKTDNRFEPSKGSQSLFANIIMNRIVIIIISLIVFSTISFAQKEKYQSIFIYNFTKYIKWPDSYNTDKFIIGVYGNSQMFDELVAMVDLKKKSGNGVKMEVQHYESITDIDDCSILFVSGDVVDKLATIDTSTTSKPMLRTIGCFG